MVTPLARSSECLGRNRSLPDDQLMSGFREASQSCPNAKEHDESRRVTRNRKRSEGTPGSRKSSSTNWEMGPDGAIEPSKSLRVSGGWMG